MLLGCTPKAFLGPLDPAPGATDLFAWLRLRATIGSGGGRLGLNGCAACGDAGAGQALSAGDAAATAAAAAAAGRVRVRVGLGGHGAWDNPGHGGSSRSTLRTMSRKKTPKSKGGSEPATSTLPAAAAATNGPRLAHPRTVRPGPEAPPNGPPQSIRPSLGSTGDFYDVAFKVSQAPPRHGNAAGGVGS